VVTVMDGGMADSKVESTGAEANNSGDDLFDAEGLKNDVGAVVAQVSSCRGLYSISNKLFCASILI
jgi:hypothetical protein